MKNDRIFICKEKEKVIPDHKSHSCRCSASSYIQTEFRFIPLFVCSLPNNAKRKKCKIEIFELKKIKKE